ncbi:MAG: hypothetical protein BAJALOKI1v1_1530002 [Promethearchaeota archaeon]|nr:MAG: hypothetical protein BAJALOKI1v1_1530002 [Candidatus Lokiarchaeota archaeon]
MVSKKRKITYCIQIIPLLLLCLITLSMASLIVLESHSSKQLESFPSLFSPLLASNKVEKHGEAMEIKASNDANSDILVDKVYTFREGIYTLNISDLVFNKLYRYTIRFAVVTDTHQCNMEVDLIDPVGHCYRVFTTDGSKLNFNEYREIPYGSAISGNYIVNFTKIDGPNLNIHIQVILDGLIFKWFDPGNNIHWGDVVKFIRPAPPPREVNYQKYLFLLPQRMYRMYIARVSPVRIDYPNKVYVDHNIIDPSEEHISFPIYNNQLMNDVFESSSYPFGTSIGGEYLFNFTFTPDMNYTNILIFITDEGQIATGKEPLPTNITALLSFISNFEFPEIGPTASIPFEAQVGIGIAASILAFMGLGIAFYIKRRSNL